MIYELLAHKTHDGRGALEMTACHPTPTANMRGSKLYCITEDTRREQ